MTWLCKIDTMRTSTLSAPLTVEIAMPNWLKFIPQLSPDTYYSLRYLIPQFSLKRIMVNVLLHRCCAAQIDSRSKLGCGVVYVTLLKRLYPSRVDYCFIPLYPPPARLPCRVRRSNVVWVETLTRVHAFFGSHSVISTNVMIKYTPKKRTDSSRHHVANLHLLKYVFLTIGQIMHGNPPHSFTTICGDRFWVLYCVGHLVPKEERAYIFGQQHM